MALFARRALGFARRSPGIASLSSQVAALENIGEHLFNDATMQQMVEAETFDAFVEAREGGIDMPKAAKNDLANGMMEWAMELGAVNFAHWASPVRGPINLLKHDAFIDLDFGGDLSPITKFSGGRLFQNETDGSSYPNGGLRETHTAAAYLSWDRASPPFVRGDTLYIPSAFISWEGDALDEKTPLLRSQEACDREGTRLLRHLEAEEGTEDLGVVCNVGWEQEFFLVDKEAFLDRPDLISTGRTLIGAPPPRGQQTDANYFARMNPRAKQALEEAQKRLWAIGVPLSVYHNEVAPGQHEFSPIFTLTNQSADQNIASIDVLSECAQQFGMVALYHEKPFAGLNGSGKHSNWGMNVKGSNRNLFVPGKTAEAQRSFITFTACLMRALHRHGDVVRVGVCSAGNDHRLGAQEAPPAIISLYTGKNMWSHMEKIIAGGPLEGYSQDDAKEIGFGTKHVANVEAAAEDRNRTAPFPFCGNRFELRAVGSDQHVGFPLAMVQAAIAESMGYVADRLDGGESLRDVLADVLNETRDIVFNGDGYSAEWQEEAAKRGLPNLKTTPDALETFASEKNKEMLASTGVLQPHEVEARQRILQSKYAEVIMLEANAMLDMLETGVIPACARDLGTYKDTGLGGSRAAKYSAVASKTAELSAAIDSFPHDATEAEMARYALESVKSVMEDARFATDVAERLVAAEHWPFPTYQTLLFDHQFDGADDHIVDDGDDIPGFNPFGDMGEEEEGEN